ncbi:MAG: hypothetical protein PVG65_00830 [Candidatus Thorarchaeota archaeon]|jgi:hypothetical protein
MHPKLRKSGYSDPEYVCPICKQSYWVRDGKIFHEKPENKETKKEEEKPDIAKQFYGNWQLPYQKYRQQPKKKKSTL